MPHRIHPSILNANLAGLDEEIRRIPSADGVHLDVMDNHFVPNLTIGLPVIQSIRANHPDRFLDVHLMITDADRFAPAYAEAGCDSVTFHIEASAAPIKTARTLRSMGARAAIALRPQTPVEPLADILSEFDMVLIMTVDPGFGGQTFLSGMLPKIRRVRELVARTGGDIWIEVDGGVSASTLDECVDAGANVFVAGSAVFSAADPDAVVRGLAKQAGERCVGH